MITDIPLHNDGDVRIFQYERGEVEDERGDLKHRLIVHYGSRIDIFAHTMIYQLQHFMTTPAEDDWEQAYYGSQNNDFEGRNNDVQVLYRLKRKQPLINKVDENGPCELDPLKCTIGDGFLVRPYISERGELLYLSDGGGVHLSLDRPGVDYVQRTLVDHMIRKNTWGQRLLPGFLLKQFPLQEYKDKIAPFELA